MLKSFVLGLVLLLSAGLADASPEPTTPSTWAVVIGIEDYPTLGISGRPFARSDSQAIYDLLVSGSWVRAPKSQVWLLMDQVAPKQDALPATADNIRHAFHSVAAKAKSEDTLLVFIKAAGLPSGDEFRWLGADADLKQLAHTTILSGELQELLANIPCRWTISLIDTCFEAPATQLGMKGAIEDANWAKLYAGFLGQGRFVFSANDGRQPSPVDQAAKHGLFASTIVTGLKGAADTQGGEADGWVSAAELWTYVRSDMPGRAKQLLGTDTNAIPKLFGGESAPHVWLARNPIVAPEVAERIEKLATKRDAGEIDADTFADGVRVLESMPRFDNERRLRRTYQEYLDGKTDVGKLSATRRQVLAERTLPPGDAYQFAETILAARDLIEKSYVKPDKGNQALAAGVLGLIQAAEEPLTTDIQDRLKALPQMSETDLTNFLMQVRLKLGRRDDLAGRRPIDLCLTSMLSSLDPFSRYVSEPALREMEKQNDGHFAGIGIKVRPDPKSGSLLVLTPLIGSPAMNAGIMGGDKIIAIDGVPTKKIGPEEAIRALADKRGKPVVLSVIADGKTAPIDLRVVRSDVTVESVLGIRRLPDYSWDYWMDRPARIGYVRLTTFASGTAEDLRTVLQQLRRDGMAGLILDLRFNPGGLLESATKVADLFLDKGDIVSVRYRDGKTDTTRASRFFTFRGFPMVVLINGQSASGSEIVAAAIADHKRGVVIGERSFGKGSVQNIYDFEGGSSALKLTVASFHRPSGKNLHRFPDSKLEDDWGVSPEPQQTVKLHREEAGKLLQRLDEQEIIQRPERKRAGSEFHDTQLERALQYLYGEIQNPRKAG